MLISYCINRWTNGEKHGGNANKDGRMRWNDRDTKETLGRREKEQKNWNIERIKQQIKIRRENPCTKEGNAQKRRAKGNLNGENDKDIEEMMKWPENGVKKEKENASSCSFICWPKIRLKIPCNRITNEELKSPTIFHRSSCAGRCHAPLNERQSDGEGVRSTWPFETHYCPLARLMLP